MCIRGSVDQDSDGDVDMWVGNQDGQLQYFENTGSKTNPVFTERTGANNPMNGVDVGYNAAPSLVDQDNDGDVDMWVGNQDGQLQYFANIGSRTNRVCTERTGANNPMNGVDVGYNAAPSLVDQDNDGDVDMRLGNRAG